MNKLIALGAVALVALFLAASSLFVVHQTQQVLITQFGQPIRVIKEPGLNWKLPFIQTVIPFDRRLLDYDSTAQEVILGDQRRLVVDIFTRYRIIDPLRYYQTVGSTEGGIRLRLGPIVSSALRNALGNEPLLAVLSNDRARIMGEIRQRVNTEALSFGIEVADVRIRRADLPEENTQAILSRMQSERERVAREDGGVTSEVLGKDGEITCCAAARTAGCASTGAPTRAACGTRWGEWCAAAGRFTGAEGAIGREAGPSVAGALAAKRFCPGGMGTRFPRVPPRSSESICSRHASLHAYARPALVRTTCETSSTTKRLAQPPQVTPFEASPRTAFCWQGVEQ